MYGSSACGKSESSHFYSMHRGEFILVSQVFSKELLIYQVFIMASSLIHNELFGTRSDKDNLEGLKKIIKVYHLEKQTSHAKKWRGSNWDCSTKFIYQKYI